MHTGNFAPYSMLGRAVPVHCSVPSRHHLIAQERLNRRDLVKPRGGMIQFLALLNLKMATFTNIAL